MTVLKVAPPMDDPWWEPLTIEGRDLSVVRAFVASGDADYLLSWVRVLLAIKDRQL